MFDLFKQDINLGDKVKLYLTTGKEPEGTVVSIGENFVLLKVDDNTQNRFFDKLIGGWDVLNPTKLEPIAINETQPLKRAEIEIDQSFLIEQVNLFKSSLNRTALTKFIEPNAHIIEVTGTTCIAANDKNPKIVISNNKIFDEKLISSIALFNEGSIIPVVLSIYEIKGKITATSAVLPAKLEDYLEILLKYISGKDYKKGNLVLSIIRNYVTKNHYLGKIINEFQKSFNQFKNKETKLFQAHVVPTSDGKNFFKSVEKEINDLIRQSKFDFALQQIDVELTNKEIEEKYKSSLLLKKAQIFSSLNEPNESERAYAELVLFNEKIKSPANNLSHLYTELARLQSLKPEKKNDAIKSVKKALEYNRNNNFADNLLKQLEGNIQKTKKEDKKKETGSDEHLLIEATDDKTVISNMIDLDIKEHKYSYPEIIKNGGFPTTFIADLIIKEARDSGGIKATENYPLYLEAAKAFSELNVGSYELKYYLEAVAYYSMLKGNSLYDQFRYNLLNKEIELQSIDRLNESACDYYIETLNIISNIDSKSLVNVLTNYLQLKVAKHYLESTHIYDYNELFKTTFTKLFNTCLWSKEEEVKKIAFKTIIDIGSYSFSMWNRLNDIFLNSSTNIKYIIDKKNNKKLINDVLNFNINIESNSKDFLKNVFNYKKKEVNEYRVLYNEIMKIVFEPVNFRVIMDMWSSQFKYIHLLQKTDKESYYVIENIIQIIQPYLNRNDKERGNILYSIIKKIENQLDFINQNTTFYGRTFFYRLLKKWRSEVDELFEEKIAQSYPLLTIEIDPPYFIESDNQVFAPLIIKNDGDATAEGYFLKIICASIEYEAVVEIPFEILEELPSKSKKEFSFVIPAEILEDTNAFEVIVEVEAIYQKNKLPSKKYEFTIEKEPSSFLTIEDIPWRTGNSTPESLFFGRDKLISDLFNHYRSINKDKPYILYGLTRTGKSSVLEYLRKKIDKTEVIKNGISARYIAFEWELQEISNNINARDFYNDILFDRLYTTTKRVLERDNKWDNSFEIDDKGKFTDFKKILLFLKSKNYYPIIFVDEFSYIMDLMNKGTIGKPFLAALREYSLNGLVSFIFAGTYDIRKLITDEKYGITGQLVHIIEHQVDKIDSDDADSLITIIDEKLSFTPEAVNHIKQLSGNIPYFIQIICKNCGDYAVENKRRFIGYPELEKVIQILTGESNIDNSIISRLPVGIFQNNQYSTTDPKEIEVLISTLCYLNKKNMAPRGIGSHEIEKFWSEKGLSAFKSKLALSFQTLIDRKILIDSLDEGLPVYKFSVDLFRRWWYMSHQDINLEISTLKEE